MTIRIEVRGQHLAAAQGILRNAAALGYPERCSRRDGLPHEIRLFSGARSRCRVYQSTLHLSIGGSGHRILRPGPICPSMNRPTPPEKTRVVEVAPRPGVTDITARELLQGMEEIGLPSCAVHDRRALRA